MTITTCDPRALDVARAVHQRERPHATILYGSRARGDHDEYRSDIDIMLLEDRVPDGESQWPVKEWLEGVARVAYGRDVSVQLVWRTLDEFRHNRRYVNSLETNAVRDGVFMSQDPNQHDSSCYEDEQTEHEYNWSPYSERMRHAELHVTALQDMIDLGRDDLLIGQQAQGALEHAMKALLEAHGVRYRRIHNIGELLGNIRHHDPELSAFSLSIPPEVYTAYAGGDEYEARTQPALTDFSDYLQRTKSDVERIIARARAVRRQRGD